MKLVLSLPTEDLSSSSDRKQKAMATVLVFGSCWIFSDNISWRSFDSMIYDSGEEYYPSMLDTGLNSFKFSFLNFHFKIQLNQFKVQKKNQLNCTFPYDFLHTFMVLVSPLKPALVPNLSRPNIEYTAICFMKMMCSLLIK